MVTATRAKTNFYGGRMPLVLYEEERDIFIGEWGGIEGCDREAFRIMGSCEESDGGMRVSSKNQTALLL